MTPRPATWAARREEYVSALADPKQSDSDRQALYEDQLARLETERRYAEAMPGHVNAIGRNCVGHVLRSCRVLGTGRLKRPGGPDILWQTQRGFTNEDGVRGGVVLLERRSSGYDVMAWSFEGYDWRNPRLVSRRGETFVVVAGQIAGTGNQNADLLYRRDQRTWHEVELESWKPEIRKRLPEGFGVWKGVNYDFDTMTARTPVWKAEDANCCPTGGQAIASLRIDGNRLMMTELKFNPRPAK